MKTLVKSCLPEKSSITKHKMTNRRVQVLIHAVGAIVSVVVAYSIAPFAEGQQPLAGAITGAVVGLIIWCTVLGLFAFEKGKEAETQPKRKLERKWRLWPLPCLTGTERTGGSIMTIKAKERDANVVRKTERKTKNVFEPVSTWLLVISLIIMLILPFIANEPTVRMSETVPQEESMRHDTRPYGSLRTEEIIPLLSPHLGRSPH